jgi:hypothetical protein
VRGQCQLLDKNHQYFQLFHCQQTQSLLITLYLQYKIVLSIQEIIKKHICGLKSIIDKCRICGTEGETIEHIISSCTVLAQSEYKKRHDIFAKIIHMNLAVKFNLLKDTQPHYIYKPESCLENDNYKLYRVLGNGLPRISG